MRAVQVMAPGRAQFVEVPKPDLRPGHALVRTRHVSLCGSDIWMLKHMPEKYYPLAPGTTGHEVVGVVEAVDDPSGTVNVGDPVLALVEGQTGMAEYSQVKLDQALLLPPDRPMEHLVQAQQLGTIIYACKFLPTSVIGKDIAVVGQGSAGLWWIWMLRRLGAHRLIAIDLQPHRLKLSPHFGATHTIHNQEEDPLQRVREITGSDGVDLVVEAAGEQSSLQLAYDLVKMYGAVLGFGVPHYDTVEIDYAAFYRKFAVQKTIAGALNDPGYNSTHQALDYIVKGEIDVAPVVTHHFPFDQVFDAYELQQTRDEGAVKIVVDFPT